LPINKALLPIDGTSSKFVYETAKGHYAPLIKQIRMFSSLKQSQLMSYRHISPEVNYLNLPVSPLYDNCKYTYNVKLKCRVVRRVRNKTFKACTCMQTPWSRIHEL